MTADLRREEIARYKEMAELGVPGDIIALHQENDRLRAIVRSQDTATARIAALKGERDLFARALEVEHPILRGPAHGPRGAERGNPFSECHECALLNDWTNGRAVLSGETRTDGEPKT